MAKRLLFSFLTANLGLTSYLLYSNHQKHTSLFEEMEVRMDELEGTLRGHIGLTEDSLQRMEERQAGKKVTGGWRQGMIAKAEENYSKRGKDDRGKQ